MIIVLYPFKFFLNGGGKMVSNFILGGLHEEVSCWCDWFNSFF